MLPLGNLPLVNILYFCISDIESAFSVFGEQKSSVDNVLDSEIR